MAYALAEADLREALPSVAVPTLLVFGDSDERSPPDVAVALHRSIPASRLVVMPGAGHACFLEFPERFNAEVRASPRVPSRLDAQR